MTSCPAVPADQPRAAAWESACDSKLAQCPLEAGLYFSCRSATPRPALQDRVVIRRAITPTRTMTSTFALSTRTSHPDLLFPQNGAHLRLSASPRSFPLRNTGWTPSTRYRTYCPTSQPKVSPSLSPRAANSHSLLLPSTNTRQTPRQTRSTRLHRQNSRGARNRRTHKPNHTGSTLCFFALANLISTTPGL
jgi:hypothetical protein